MNSNPERPAFDDEEDSRMIAGIANGDRQCFRDLHARYDGLLFTTIEKVLNDREDSAEVLQEVLSSLWRKGHLYHPGRGRPVTWLASMARNRAIDRLRAKQRQARLKTAYLEEHEWRSGVPDTPDGPELAARREACSAVRSAVMELTDVQREAIEKVYFEGLSQQEIADQLGEPLGTVKARIRRGLAKLRQVVAKE